MEEVKPRDIVVSLAGHDSGRAYAVIRTDGKNAYLADGKIKKLANPKKKSLKHLRLGKVGTTALTELDLCSTAADSVIRKQLAIFRGEADVTEEGSQLVKRRRN